MNQIQKDVVKECVFNLILIAILMTLKKNLDLKKKNTFTFRYFNKLNLNIFLKNIRLFLTLHEGFYDSINSKYH